VCYSSGACCYIEILSRSFWSVEGYKEQCRHVDVLVSELNFGAAKRWTSVGGFVPYTKYDVASRVNCFRQSLCFLSQEEIILKQHNLSPLDSQLSQVTFVTRRLVCPVGRDAPAPSSP
jgi:hypothetical protein